MRSMLRIPTIVRAAFAEFIGTYILILIGNGSIAQAKLSNGEKGNFFAINWGWALGATLGILVSANVSGGHLNPAVTLALALQRTFSWRKIPIYWIAQYLGALAASGTVLGIYQEAIAKAKGGRPFTIETDPSTPGMAAIFANYPASYSSTGVNLIEEIMATMLFMLFICVVTDSKYTKIPSFLQPLYIGSGLLAIGIAYGSNGGYGLNPARDLAPRLVSYFGGFGPNVFSFRGYNWFWIFIVGPHIGAVLGICLFQLLLKSYESVQDNELDLVRTEEASSRQQQQQCAERYNTRPGTEELRIPTILLTEETAKSPFPSPPRQA